MRGELRQRGREWRKCKACSSESSVDKEYTWYKINTKKVFFCNGYLTCSLLASLRNLSRSPAGMSSMMM